MYKVLCQPSFKEFGDGHLESPHTLMQINSMLLHQVNIAGPHHAHTQCSSRRSTGILTPYGNQGRLQYSSGQSITVPQALSRECAVALMAYSLDRGSDTYIDTVLPPGLQSAPKIFSAFADALAWILGEHGVT